MPGTLNRLRPVEALCGGGKNGSNSRILIKVYRKLRRIYRENPELFNAPNFAQKVY